MKQETVLNYHMIYKHSEPRELEQQKARVEIIALDGNHEIVSSEDGDGGSYLAWKKMSEDVEDGKISCVVAENKDRFPEEGKISALCEVEA